MAGRPTCNLVCVKLKPTRTKNTEGVFIYQGPVKRCNTCERFVGVKEDTVFCPCCMNRLRQGPRSTKQKKRREKKYIE